MPTRPTPANANAGRPAKAVAAEPLNFSADMIGNTGLRQTGGYISEEFIKELSGLKGRRTFREMADNDSTIGGMLFAIDNLIRGVEWNVKAADDTSEAEAGKAFLEEVIADMNTPFDSVLSEINSMFTYGFAPMEIIWKHRTSEPDEIGLPKSKFDDGKVGIAALSLRAQETIHRWEIDDETGHILGVWQQPLTKPMCMIPKSKLLLFRTTSVKNNPEGRSILRNAYRDWYFKKRIEEIEAIGIERDLAGLPVMRIPAQYMAADATPQDKAVYAAYKRLVTQVRRDQMEGVIIPSTKDKEGHYLFEFNLLTTGGSRSFDTSKVIERKDRAIATSVLADFMFLGQSAVGSFALSSDKTALFAEAVQAFLARNIAGRFNDELIPRLWYLNGLPPETMPTMEPGDIEEAALGEVGALIQVLTAAGAQMFPDRELENHLRRRMGLPQRAEDGADDMAPEVAPPETQAAAGGDGEDMADDE